ncbi:MAG: Fic family protein [Alphaproteobacteria bacterium]|nr:Fic family protein [Alphaproteobacteria bacterium]
MEIKTTQERSAALKSTYQIPALPLPQDLETKAVLKKTKEARAALAELKGVALSVPNQTILISTLSLQEAKDSSAIENIITTNDELYQSDAIAQQYTSTAAKEVHRYASALRNGFQQVKNNGLLTNNLIKSMQAELEGNDAGFRSQGGTALKNQQTGEVVYTPPQELQQIESHMQNLERFIHEDVLCDWDALVKMAIIHHQFESIHPFFDGNGRTGRILNILYLVKQGLLDTPILYLSRYINQHKPEYYRLLQKVRDQGAWEEWVMFMLEGVRATSYQTIRLIEEMKRLMLKHKNKMRTELKNIYTQDFLNLIFSHPYTKISHVEEALEVTRKTATKYLDELVRIGLLQKMKIGRESYYINQDLMECLSNVHGL